MKVIIADDSAFIRDRLQDMVSQFQMVEIVGLCKNGTETLEALRIKKADLAIVDIKMPGMSGLDVLREIRKENKIMQIVIFTFHAVDYYRQMALEAGADYFFSKSDDFDKVGLVINRMLNSKAN